MFPNDNQNSPWHTQKYMRTATHRNWKLRLADKDSTKKITSRLFSANQHTPEWCKMNAANDPKKNYAPTKKFDAKFPKSDVP